MSGVLISFNLDLSTLPKPDSLTVTVDARGITSVSLELPDADSVTAYAARFGVEAAVQEHPVGAAMSMRSASMMAVAGGVRVHVAGCQCTYIAKVLENGEQVAGAQVGAIR